jgi:hypothetical protein
MKPVRTARCRNQTNCGWSRGIRPAAQQAAGAECEESPEASPQGKADEVRTRGDEPDTELLAFTLLLPVTATASEQVDICAVAGDRDERHHGKVTFISGSEARDQTWNTYSVHPWSTYIAIFGQTTNRHRNESRIDFHPR